MYMNQQHSTLLLRPHLLHIIIVVCGDACVDQYLCLPVHCLWIWVLIDLDQLLSSLSACAYITYLL